LAELLEEKGKSRYWLAQKSGVTPTTITKLFRGETNGIDFGTLNAICEALECQTNDVISFEKEGKIRGSK
jgi:putative transcriptional regulator